MASSCSLTSVLPRLHPHVDTEAATRLSLTWQHSKEAGIILICEDDGH